MEHESISEYHVIREHFYRMHRLVKLRRYPELVEGAMKYIAIISLLALSGCATVQPWERARPECLQFANAACISAMLHDKQAGVVICTLPGTTDRHAVTWIIDNGVTLYWDASWHRYRTQAELGEVHYIVEGTSAGAFDVLPMPKNE